jgi:hypothetical protein
MAAEQEAFTGVSSMEERSPLQGRASAGSNTQAVGLVSATTSATRDGASGNGQSNRMGADIVDNEENESPNASSPSADTSSSNDACDGSGVSDWLVQMFDGVDDNADGDGADGADSSPEQPQQSLYEQVSSLTCFQFYLYISIYLSIYLLCI